MGFLNGNGSTRIALMAVLTQASTLRFCFAKNAHVRRLLFELSLCLATARLTVCALFIMSQEKSMLTAITKNTVEQLPNGAFLHASFEIKIGFLLNYFLVDQHLFIGRTDKLKNRFHF